MNIKWGVEIVKCELELLKYAIKNKNMGIITFCRDMICQLKLKI